MTAHVFRFSTRFLSHQCYNSFSEGRGVSAITSLRELLVVHVLDVGTTAVETRLDSDLEALSDFRQSLGTDLIQVSCDALLKLGQCLGLACVHSVLGSRPQPKV